jgi:hypothetical protein
VGKKIPQKENYLGHCTDLKNSSKAPLKETKL